MKRKAEEIIEDLCTTAVIWCSYQMYAFGNCDKAYEHIVESFAKMLGDDEPLAKTFVDKCILPQCSAELGESVKNFIHEHLKSDLYGGICLN